MIVKFVEVRPLILNLKKSVMFLDTLDRKTGAGLVKGEQLLRGHGTGKYHKRFTSSEQEKDPGTEREGPPGRKSKNVPTEVSKSGDLSTGEGPLRTNLVRKGLVTC